MTIKKAELHVHLEGTIPPDLVRTLAKRNNITLPDGLISPDNRGYLSQDFLHFLKVYDIVASVIKTPRDYYDITYDYLRNSALDDTIYTEMMYSPDHAELSSGIPSREHLEAIQQAIDDAESQYGITGKIIITAVRHFGVESCNKVAERAGVDRFPCVTGFGLGGDEIHFPPELFKKTYEIAAANGLYCTIHAGEFGTPESMIYAMENLPIQRIGHGVNAMYSPDAMHMLKDRNIALELCPSSNIFLGLFKNMESHPLPKFMDFGIQISISSDDPPFMNTTIGEEYRRAQKAWEFSDKTMQSITIMALKSAFLDDKTKSSLIERC